MRFGTAMHFRRILDYYERRDFIFLNIQKQMEEHRISGRFDFQGGGTEGD